MTEAANCLPPGTVDNQLPIVLISLLKGVLYRDSDLKLWSSLIQLRVQAGHYLSAFGLTLHIDETEGYAYLRSAFVSPDEEESVPRLVARRPLTFYDSLLLALLRKKLAEFDASGTENKLTLKRDQIQELVALFLPDHTDEVKLRNRIDPSLQRLQDMGFLRKLKSTGDLEIFEVLRIIKAFVDAQWLNGFEVGLASYRNHSAEN